jgi:hypothetical protein
MNKKTIEQRILKQYLLFLGSVPMALRKSFLLTGGSAAFLYGSDRPFSDDIDLIVSFEKLKEIEKAVGASFAYRKKKPVFHSLAATIEIGKTSFDLMAESVIQPVAKGKAYAFRATPEIRRKKVVFQFGKNSIACLPKEVLVIKKLLAGRGIEVGKYDLYDVKAIIEKNDDFDYGFFKKIIRTFCKPLKSSVPVLIRHAKKIQSDYPKCKAIQTLLDSLGSLR